MRRWAPIALSLLALAATAGCGTGADPTPAPAPAPGATMGAASAATTGYDAADARYRQMFQGLNLPAGVTFPAHLPNGGDQYQINAGLVSAQNFWMCAWLWNYVDNASTKSKADAAITQLAKYDLMDAYAKGLDEHGRQAVDAAVRAAKAGSRAQVQSFADATCTGPFYGQSRPGTH